MCPNININLCPSRYAFNPITNEVYLDLDRELKPDSTWFIVGNTIWAISARAPLPHVL